MSYLVDALRKAERERLQGAAPGKATLAVDVPYDAERSGLWMVGWVVAILVVCNLFLFGYLLWPTARAPSDMAAPQAAAAGLAPSGYEAKPRTVQVANQTVSSPEVAQQAEIAPRRTSSTAGVPRVGADDGHESDWGGSREPPYPTGAAQSRSIPARGEVPPVNIHGHLFSADPAESFILVNGRIYHEGERLPDGVAVVRIDQEGAVLNYRGRRFHVNGPG